jgi:hypothetical protein
MTDKTFRNRCDRVSGATGIEVMYFEDDPLQADAFEDDGTLHIRQASGLRACFDVGNSQSLSGREQNVRTRAVMDMLGLKVTDRVLTDDTDDDDEDVCPECGRPR